MKSRIYFLLPDIDLTRRVADELLVARIEQRHIHVLAKEGTPLEALPSADLRYSSDLVKALERGAAVGGATGLLAGLIAVTLPPVGLVLGGGAVLLSTLAGAGIGAWASALIGASLPNSELQRFEAAIEGGEILMLVDLPNDRVEEIKDLVKGHHPEAEIAGTTVRGG